MKNLVIDNSYQSKLDLLQTQVAIKFVKDCFQVELSKALNLTRVSAPLFVFPDTGLNDDLNGYERPVSFDIKNISRNVEIIHSLAKWKRNALREYQIEVNNGIYTDMNAIRRDEDLDSVHSIYVDQWDWEKVITNDQRNEKYLHDTVRTIYQVIKLVAEKTKEKFPSLNGLNLPEDITFLKASEMLMEHPEMNAKAREDFYAKKFKAIFIQGIGWPLQDGNPHDGRAADYDDWNLNGDLLVWDEVIKTGLELSSMGIRVDSSSLIKQLDYKGENSKLSSPYHQDVLHSRLPFSIGGGIGQSRLCMLMLEKIHIGEVQASVWPSEDIKLLKKAGIKLL